MFLKNDSFILKDRQCQICVLALISCKNRANRASIYLLQYFQLFTQLKGRRLTYNCENNFTTIITTSTHLSFLLTFNVEVACDISLVW